MSDWTKQAEQLVNTWSETQKKLWDNWLEAAQTMSGGANLKALESERKKAVDAWEASVKKGLEAQTEWAKMWVDGLAANKSTPKPTLEWAKQMQGMMKSWTNSQTELAHVWFEMVKKVDTSDMGDMWETQGKGMVKAWQEAVDKSVEAQHSMSQFWTQAAQTTQKKV